MVDATPPDAAGGACHSLLYASAALFPPQDVLLDIVRTADRANARHGLSGMLVYTPLRYVQLVEGPRPALEGLWHCLRRDLRHRILWCHWGAAAPRAIPVRLPMGYASDVQVRAAGLGLPPWSDRVNAEEVADLAAALGTLARDLYPVSCCRDPAAATGDPGAPGRTAPVP